MQNLQNMVKCYLLLYTILFNKIKAQMPSNSCGFIINDCDMMYSDWLLATHLVPLYLPNDHILNSQVNICTIMVCSL